MKIISFLSMYILVRKSVVILNRSSTIYSHILSSSWSHIKQRRLKMKNSLPFSSRLYDERTFYQTFLKDLKYCQSEIIVESPFITTARMKTFDRILQSLLEKNVKIYIITRNPLEHTDGYEYQSEEAVRWCEEVGIQVLLCQGNHHRKLAILDRKILWEGSLNILSQANSREIMRRIDSGNMAKEMFSFLHLQDVL